MSIWKNDADVILNRTNVALARSQRLVASWLPPKTAAEESATSKSEEELRQEEDEIFTAVPERLGLGAPLPQKEADGSWNRGELDSNEKLRKQLLGRNYQKVMKKTASTTNQSHKRQDVGNGASDTASSPMPLAAGKERKDGNEDDDEDDEGRTSLVGRSKKKRAAVAVDGSGDHDNGASDQAQTAAAQPDGAVEEEMLTKKQNLSSKGKRRATSFLDEILADRGKKKKKR